ncbi:MAG TPA: BTAD domain-containing putative transcriptional regulator [Solirubrobacteraceae bacterium]|nr:BTAD domain-containing putative transcriptional regulator [Solirubrobacteraceae bacterium]
MEFRILGPLEVRSGGRTIAVGGEKRRALLALLVLQANEPVSAERLAQALWGEDVAIDAVKTVRVHVSRIRSALDDPDALVTTPAGYRLRVRPGELDADCFEDLLERGRRALENDAPAEAAELLRTALGLWRGSALADVRYAAFAQTAIGRLEELRWDAIEARNDADLQLGRADAVLAELERGGNEAPLRERLVEQRMRALYAAGRHVEALAAYRHTQRRLDDELGLQPGPALRELERAILAHDASLRRDALDGPAPPATATVGREGELAALATMIGDRRLITLTGPGGVGKTRVALETARALAGRFPGGVHVAYLAKVTAAGDVPNALARAVQVAVQPGERDEEALVRRLRGPATLLVADNVEHVLDASPLFGELVAACPRLHVLATSREPLRLQGEQCHPIPPLKVSDAITLFVDRARDRRPDFGLNDDNAPAVAELCRRLDGLPLAVELAAGRMALLEPEQLVARLADMLPLLEGGARDAPARQRTIRATLEWSFALLDAEEQRVFRALAVFVGGAELDAAAAVTGGCVAGLDALVAKSLVQVRQGRVTQLEMVRQFAAAELARTPDADDLQRRHADHYLALAERLGPQVRVRGRGPAFDGLERELGNLRAALDAWISRGDGERALRLAAAIEPYWSTSCHYRDGVAMVDAALAAAPDAGARERGRARRARAILLRHFNPDETVDDANAALELSTAAGDLEGRCLALDMVAAHARYLEDHDRAQALAGEERALAEQLGDPYLVAMAVMRQSWSAHDFGAARRFADEARPLLRRCGNLDGIIEMVAGLVGPALVEGAYEAAAEVAEEGLRAAEEAGGSFTLALSLGNAGLAALFLERMDVAEARFREQLEIQRRERIDGFWDEPVAGLACVAAAGGDGERAAKIIGGCDALLPSLPSGRVDLWLRDELLARFVAPARAALGERAWKRGAAVGAAMTLDELCEFALDRRPAAAAREL